MNLPPLSSFPEHPLVIKLPRGKFVFRKDKHTLTRIEFVEKYECPDHDGIWRCLRDGYRLKVL